MSAVDSALGAALYPEVVDEVVDARKPEPLGTPTFMAWAIIAGAYIRKAAGEAQSEQDFLMVADGLCYAIHRLHHSKLISREQAKQMGGRVEDELAANDRAAYLPVTDDGSEITPLLERATFALLLSEEARS